MAVSSTCPRIVLKICCLFYGKQYQYVLFCNYTPFISVITIRILTKSNDRIRKGKSPSVSKFNDLFSPPKDVLIGYFQFQWRVEG